MGDLEHGIFSLLVKMAAMAGGPAPSFIPSPKVPAGLTLRSTITTSQTPTKTSWPEWVYVVAVGGGGSGSGASAVGGGGGACIQGWMRSDDVGAVTIGAGAAGGTPGNGYHGLKGSATSIGPIRAPGGGGGGRSGLGEAESVTTALNVEPGAGQGGIQASGNASTSTNPIAALAARDNLAYGMFSGGKCGLGFSVPVVGTSGAGAAFSNVALPYSAGDGNQGPGGGGGGNNSAAAASAGGSSVSPNGTTYTGGTASAANGNGGGGAGILGNGGNATATSGGAGGSGGGGGGGTSTSPNVGGAGGNGAVLIYW